MPVEQQAVSCKRARSWSSQLQLVSFLDSVLFLSALWVPGVTRLLVSICAPRHAPLCACVSVSLIRLCWCSSVPCLLRNLQMLGPGGQRLVSSSFVLVVGLGGVGSHAAAMLLRGGVGRLRLVDFDQVRGCLMAASWHPLHHSSYPEIMFCMKPLTTLSRASAPS